MECAGLDQLEKYHLTQCLVNETKKKESRKSRADTPPSNMIEETVETSPPENTCPAQNVKLRYILDGLAGELEIDVRRTKQISVDILVSNLKQDEQDKNTETKRKRMQYERRRINDVFVWLPAGVSANMLVKQVPQCSAQVRDSMTREDRSLDLLRCTDDA